MNIVFTIQHPAHVHFFRNAIAELKESENIKVVVRDKEMSVDLLNFYDIEHTVLADWNGANSNFLLSQLEYELATWRIVRQFDCDVVIGVGGLTAAHASTLNDAKSIIFTDTEHARFQNQLAFPFADRIYTPECYKGEIGPKQIRYPGYHELAYLHPNRFEPDPEILDTIGVTRDKKLVILRLISWEAVHDIGDSGFNDVIELVSKLESRGAKVLITSEDDLPEKIEHCRANIPAHKIHDLMYYSDIFIGESATMATESAVLGTPAIFVSSSRRGYTDELEEEYGLVYNFSGPHRQQRGLQKALSILDDYDPSRWEQKRIDMLNNKIDTTDFMLSQLSESSSHYN